MIKLKSITIFPIKALDGIDVESILITEGGKLKFDREFAMIDTEGNYVNGKRNINVHFLNAVYDLTNRNVNLSIKNKSEDVCLNLDSQQKEIEDWLSSFFKMKIKFVQDKKSGFPDDRVAWGPTITSFESIQEISKWFDNVELASIKKRFRPNLIIENVPPFWEDQLYGKDSEEISFEVGNVKMIGVNPCQRCIVPSRNPIDAESYNDFQKIFMEKRDQTLPAWAEKSRFNHYYKFCINTKIPYSEAGKILNVENEISIEKDKAIYS